MKSTNYMGYSIISNNHLNEFRIALPKPWGLYGEFKTLEAAKNEIRSWEMSETEHATVQAKRAAEVEGSGPLPLELARAFSNLVKRARQNSEAA